MLPPGGGSLRPALEGQAQLSEAGRTHQIQARFRPPVRGDGTWDSRVRNVPSVCHISRSCWGPWGVRSKTYRPFGVLDDTFVKRKIPLKTNHGLLSDEAAPCRRLPLVFAPFLSCSGVCPPLCRAWGSTVPAPGPQAPPRGRGEPHRAGCSPRGHSDEDGAFLVGL